MPELPEVETVKNVLIPLIRNHKILSIEILRKSTISGDMDTFVKELTNEIFLDVSRIGKFLIIHLSNDKVIISHLRMEGKYYMLNESEPDSKYSRIIFHLDNNLKLCYDDSRSFGRMRFSTESNYLKEKEIAKIGPSPFEISDITTIFERCKKSNLTIKTTLLDQSLISGLGNIYADEVLFLSKVHPLTPAKHISLNTWGKIVENARIILNKAIQAGGSTIKSYHPGKDISGNFQVELQAYGKKVEPCPVCGKPFSFIKVNGRGTTFCNNCQAIKSKQLKVAIYGRAASGKSTVLNYIASLGYPTLSADEVVSNLYSSQKVAEHIKKMFNLPFTDKVDKNILREYLVNHPKDIRKLNNYVHPLVKKEVLNFLNTHKEPLLFVEIPLLYESKMESLFDFVIALNITKENQWNRIQSRNQMTYTKLLQINKDSKFDENKEKADIIINNDFSISILKNNINQIINKLKNHLIE